MTRDTQTTLADTAAEHRKALKEGMEPSVVRKYAEYHLGRVRTLMPSAIRDRAVTDLSVFLLELPHGE